LVSDMISHVKILLGENALLLVRPSGTEDLIRITISHQDILLVDETTQMLVDIINKEGIKR
jgi:phosphoglucosamine mutase